ncbi:MAG: hypothetical protein Ct9H300mP21_08120 [Pseudomonadota bacterium]|nr:MAG: hypothetical protein Ct9H300mP21_08120 [Pseudomonadota bacterium]
MKQNIFGSLKAGTDIKFPNHLLKFVESFGEPFHVPKEMLSEEAPGDLGKLETILQELALKTEKEISTQKKKPNKITATSIK